MEYTIVYLIIWRLTVQAISLMNTQYMGLVTTSREDTQCTNSLTITDSGSGVKTMS